MPCSTARHPFLQEAGTLKGIRGLAELDLLPNEDALRLEEAYRFLRRVEHRLQIEAEQQTHTVPEEGEALEGLARSLGFAEGAALGNLMPGAHRLQRYNAQYIRSDRKGLFHWARARRERLFLEE